MRPVLSLRDLHNHDLDDALTDYAESYGQCKCGSDYEAEDLGDYRIRVTCKRCGIEIRKYEGPDYD